MPKKWLDVDWNREIGKEDLKPAVKRYRRYLEDKGLRASTIPMYVLHVSKYLEFVKQIHPVQMILPDFAIYSMIRNCLEVLSIIIHFQLKNITRCWDRM
jgi:hypothetical protein